MSRVGQTVWHAIGVLWLLGLLLWTGGAWGQSAACRQCQQQACPAQVAACDARCNEIAACYIHTDCIAQSAVFCYCGTAPAAACATQAGAANGPCVGVIGQLPPILPPLLEQQLGAASELATCSRDNCASACYATQPAAVPALRLPALALLVTGLAGAHGLLRRRDSSSPTVTK